MPALGQLLPSSVLPHLLNRLRKCPSSLSPRPADPVSLVLLLRRAVSLLSVSRLLVSGPEWRPCFRGDSSPSSKFVCFHITSRSAPFSRSRSGAWPFFLGARPSVCLGLIASRVVPFSSPKPSGIRSSLWSLCPLRPAIRPPFYREHCLLFLIYETVVHRQYRKSVFNKSKQFIL